MCGTYGAPTFHPPGISTSPFRCKAACALLEGKWSSLVMWRWDARFRVGDFVYTGLVLVLYV